MGVIAALMVVPIAATAVDAPSLRILDDREQTISSRLTVCFYQGLTTACIDRPPYRLPGSLSTFESLTIEGPEHGPIAITRQSLRVANDGTYRVSLPRKARLLVQNLPVRPLTASLYRTDDLTFRKPSVRSDRLPPEGARVPSGEYVLSLSDGVHAPQLQLFKGQPGSTHTIRYNPRPGWSVLTRSVSRNGRKALPTRVQALVSAPDGTERVIGTAEAGRNGLAILQGLAEHYVKIRLTANGYLPDVLPAVMASPGAFTFRDALMTRGGEVMARVHLDGVPARGARCQILEARAGADGKPLPPLSESRVREDGTCLSNRIREGSLLLRVLPVEAPHGVDRLITIGDERTAHVDVELESILVLGRVSRGNRPERGAVVQISNTTDAAQESSGRNVRSAPAEAITNEDGSYEAVLWTAGQYFFVVRAGGIQAPGALRVAEIPSNGARVDFQLHQDDLTGQVLDQDDRPVPAASVHLTFDRRDHLLSDTEPNGRFRFPLPGPGHAQLEATKRGYERSAIVELAIGEGPPPPVVLKLPKLESIKGKVALPSGAPAVNVGVASYAVSPGRPSTSLASVLTDSQGTFEIPRAIGGVTRLFVTGAGCPLMAVDLPDDAEEQLLRCAGAAAGLDLLMTDPRGRPLPNETIILRWAGKVIPRELLQAHQRLLGLSAHTDGTGRLPLVGLPDGPYDLFSGAGSSEETISGGLTYGFLISTSLSLNRTTELEIQMQPVR